MKRLVIELLRPSDQSNQTFEAHGQIGPPSAVYMKADSSPKSAIRPSGRRPSPTSREPPFQRDRRDAPDAEEPSREPSAIKPGDAEGRGPDEELAAGQVDVDRGHGMSGDTSGWRTNPSPPPNVVSAPSGKQSLDVQGTAMSPRMKATRILPSGSVSTTPSCARVGSACQVSRQPRRCRTWGPTRRPPSVDRDSSGSSQGHERPPRCPCAPAWMTPSDAGLAAHQDLAIASRVASTPVPARRSA